MARARQLAYLCLAAVGLFLPVGLKAKTVAEGTVAVIHVPGAAIGSRVEWDATDDWSANWEVSVTLDAKHCDIYCAIRRKRDPHGLIPALDLLLPPAVVLRVYSDFVSRPITALVDPAGRTAPCLRNRLVSQGNEEGAPGKRALTISLAPDHRATSPFAPPARVVTSSLPSGLNNLPLRI